MKRLFFYLTTLLVVGAFAIVSVLSPLSAATVATNVLDSDFYLAVQDGNPLINFLPNSYMFFLRSTKTLYLTIDGIGRLAVNSNGVAGAARSTTGALKRICAGSTPSGSTSWVQYQTNTLYVDIDISGCGFPSQPVYTASLTGISSHFTAVGMTSIYPSGASAFRVYVTQTGVTPAQANSWLWAVNWVAVGD